MQLINKIKRRLEATLPGEESQYMMAPMGRKELATSLNHYTRAAVLCLIYPKQNLPHMVFIERAFHEKDKHSAQVAFPGGRVEKEDPTIVAAALREAQEEIGVIPETVSILGELTPLRVPVSGYEIFPVLAHTEMEPYFRRQITEVARIIEVPVRNVIDPHYRITQSIELSSGMILKNVPAFKFNNDVIWGATSMMLNEIIEIVR